MAQENAERAPEAEPAATADRSIFAIMQELELRLQLHVALTRNDDERASLLQQQIDALKARAAGGGVLNATSTVRGNK